MPSETSSSGATRVLLVTAVLLAFAFFGFVYTTTHIKAVEAKLPEAAPETTIPGIAITAPK